MEQCTPFAEMGTTCQTREIVEKKVKWPDIGTRQYCGGRYRARAISIYDFEKTAELWRIAYPEIYGSSYEWMLFPDEYEKRVAIAENWEKDRHEKNQCILIIEDTENAKIIGGNIYAKDDKNLNIEFSIGALHPDYRKTKDAHMIILANAEALKIMEEESGAEYFSAYCETWHNITQYLCLKQWGWKVGGILPGHFTIWCGDNREYRGCSVYFYKLLEKGEKYSTKPSEWKLLPEFEKLWKVLEEINNGSDDAAMRAVLSGNI